MAAATHNEPVHLVEDEETGDRFLIYGTERGIRVELKYDGETLWMTQSQIAALFGVDRSVITKHLANAFAESELDESTSAKIAQVRREGSREVTRQIEHYNLDAIISVGYRVSSKQGTMFRRWATEKLVQFATKGFVVDTPRLKARESQDRIAELREIVRDIRSDEANVYRELRGICALCQDYDGESEVWRNFYARTQAKLMWAVTSHTPSEIVVMRCNASAPDLGLKTWAHDRIRKDDVDISKNYLAEPEIKELNRLTTILLDIFEDQLDIGKLTTMESAARLLDEQLKSLNRQVLKDGGRISTRAAKRHAEEQYRAFDAKRKELRHAQADQDLAAVKKLQKDLGKPPHGGRK